jgi:malonyl-CoA/methylmalonyl-CoA synthetase
VTRHAATDLHALLARAAACRGEHPAIAGADGAVWSHARLSGAAARLARGLARRGLAPGDRVALAAGASPEWALAALAVLGAGGVVLPVNTAYRAREVAHLLADAEPRCVIGGRAELAVVAAVDPAARRSVETVVPIAELTSWIATEPAPASDGRQSEPASIDPGALALLLYTSGTTGRSKGAMLTHANLGAMIAALHEAWEWSEDDALLLPLPLFHLHGLVVGLLSALAAGASVLLASPFDAARLADRLAAGEATLFFGVPTLYVRLVEELARRGGRRDLPRVRLFVSGSAPLAPETHAAFRALTGHAILERYGMTETGMLTSNPLRGERRPGTVGLPLPGVELRVMVPGAAEAPGELPVAAEQSAAPSGGSGRSAGRSGETGRSAGRLEETGRSAGRSGETRRSAPGVDPEAGEGSVLRPARAGEEGEIEVRGPGVFAGYWRAPEKTAESFRTDEDGRRWFRTGDRGRVDPANGYLTLLGRASELILSGGFNVYPREIEEVLLALPGVREAAVVGEPHPEYGESPVAFLVLDRALSDGELDAHCRAQLAPFKRPRRFVRVDELPRNALGKLEKHRLRISGTVHQTPKL